MALGTPGVSKRWVTMRFGFLIQVVLLAEMVVVAKVLILVVEIFPGDPVNISPLSAVDASHAWLHKVCAKDDAPENICSMLVTLVTSH